FFTDNVAHRHLPPFPTRRSSDLFEYPDYICSRYNDFYVAIMKPAVGTPDGNIAFDKQGNVISVNNGLLAACAPHVAGGKSFTCPDRKSTRLNSSHSQISYAVFCL